MLNNPVSCDMAVKGAATAAGKKVADTKAMGGNALHKANNEYQRTSDQSGPGIRGRAGKDRWRNCRCLGGDNDDFDSQRWM